MIRKASEIATVTTEGFKGGKGELISRDIRTAEELGVHGRKFGYSMLPPGASIGNHTHSGDSETYYIISGCGTYNDNGTIVKVGPGDVMHCADGETHGIENTGSLPLEFIALILYTA